MAFNAAMHLPSSMEVFEARAALAAYQLEISSIEEKIQQSKQELVVIAEQTAARIKLLSSQRQEYASKVTQTLAYISPIRRLPPELMREIFRAVFENPEWDGACAGWVLASVCSLWRGIALGMPSLWSRIRLRTCLTDNPDTVRLWLERSGNRCPLDIEIHLRVGSAVPSPTPHHTQHVIWHGPGSIPVVHIPPPGSGHGISHLGTPTGITSPSSPAPDNQSSSNHHVTTRTGVHWAHIAFYYLVEQMPRWSRFVFTFEKSFPSISALKSISGDAPLLREFVVTCTEPTFINENWTWLPCGLEAPLPSLRRLELHNVPFKWSSPMLSGLTVLKLGSLSSHHTISRSSLSIDRVLSIIKANPQLEDLELAFPSAQDAVLPLTPVTLDRLSQLCLSGHHLLSTVLDQLVLPSLTSLILDIEPRDTLEESLTNLVTRSSSPPLIHLSLAYGSSSATSTMYYTGPLSITFLADMPHLTTLKIGQTALEPLLSTLASPEDDWVCPRLFQLSLKSCHPHGGTEGVAKLVQMVQSRNPSGSGSSASSFPARLKKLEMYDCGAHVGTDVLKWLNERIGEVVCVESNYLRSPSPGYY